MTGAPVQGALALFEQTVRNLRKLEDDLRGFAAAAPTVDRALHAMDTFGQELAKAMRNAGVATAALAQAQAEPTWSWRAEAAIVQVARRQATVHVDDVLRIFPDKPAHPNAWGAVWMRAIRAGVIERTGTVRPCEADPAKRAHQYPVYSSKVFTS